MLPRKIHIETIDGTAGMPTALPRSLFVLLSVSLLINTFACTEMLWLALGLETSIFSHGLHLNTPLSFSPAPVSWLWHLLWQAANLGLGPDIPRLFLLFKLLEVNDWAWNLNTKFRNSILFCYMQHFILLINPYLLSHATLIHLLYLWFRIITKQLRATLELRDKMVCTGCSTNVKHAVW